MDKGDSGASTHFIREKDAHSLLNNTMYNGPAVQQPDNTQLKTTCTGILPISATLSTKAKQALLLPNLKSASLISLDHLCNDIYDVILLEERLKVIKNS